MARKERARALEPRTARPEPAAPDRVRKPPSGAFASKLPSPAVAAMILEGAERTPPAQPRASPKRPSIAPAPLASGRSPARSRAQIPDTGPAKPGTEPRRLAGAAPLAIVPKAMPPTGATGGPSPSTAPAPVEGPEPGSGMSAPGAAPTTAPVDAGGGAAEAPAKEGPKGEGAKEATPGAAPAKEGKVAKEGGGEEAADGEGAAADAKLKMPEPPKEISSRTKKRIQGVKARAGGAATAHADLPKGPEQVGDARVSVTEPDAEAKARAANDLVAMLADKPEPSPEIIKFAEKIRKVIRDKRPPDEDALAEAKPESEALDAGNQLNQSVQDGTKSVQDNYGSMEKTPEGGKPAEGKDLKSQPETEKTASIDAKKAKPDAIPAENVSLDADAADSKKKMQDAGMEKPAAAVVQSGPIAEARGAQGELEQVAKEDPAKVLASQKETLAKAEDDMAGLQAQALAALTNSRAGTSKQATSRQKGMIGSEESMRAAAGAEAQKTFQEAQSAVKALLDPLASSAMAEWEAAKVLLVSQFKTDLADVQRRVDDRHSGVGGFFVGLWDAVTGLPSWAERDYTKAEYNFSEGVIAKITAISVKVNTVIASCETIIRNARASIAKTFADLPGSLSTWAETERAKFDVELGKLHDEAMSARDSFNKGLIEDASAAVDEVRAEVSELRKKAGGLIGRIANAIARFIDDPVKFIIEGILDILGIPPASFWAVVAKIKKVIGQIADDPKAFINNLMDGLSKGFGQFFDNFGTHLLKGFLDWITGGLASVGVKLPKDLSPKSILTFFLQLMGITWPRIRKVLAKHLGAKNVALAEKVYGMLSFLIEKGPEGIYEMVKEKLNPETIVDQVVQLAVDYMIEAVVKAAAKRILLLFNPVGAIVAALEAIYRVLKWVFQNAAKIFALVETVVNGIADILAGNLGGFANAVEKGLAMLIAPVISFIADYAGLGDLPRVIADKIKEFQEFVMGLIEQALVWLIEKGKALLAAVGIGKKDDKKKGDKFDGTIGETVRWTAEDEFHEMWVGEEGGEPEVMMASGKKGPVRKKLAEYAEQAADLKGSGAKDRKERAEQAIGEATGILDDTTAAAKATKAAQANPEAQPDEAKAKDDETESWEQKLWPQLQIIQIALRLIEIPKTVVLPGAGGKASRVTAEPLSKKGKGGSGPRGKLKGWEHVLRIDNELLNEKNAQWGPAYWVAGHLLSERLHGPGDPWNTVPLRKTDNKVMELGVEVDSIKRIQDEEVLYYDVGVTYHAGEVLEDFPDSLEVERGSMQFKDGKWIRGDELPGLSLTIDKPPLDPQHTPDINNLRRDSLYKRGVPIRFAMAIVEERDSGGKFSDENDLYDRMAAAYSAQTHLFQTSYWPSLARLIPHTIQVGDK